MPDYSTTLNDSDFVTFQSKGTLPPPRREGGTVGSLDARAYEQAGAAAPGWDVYAIEGHWRDWCRGKGIQPKRPGGALVKFCRSWNEKRGRP